MAKKTSQASENQEFVLPPIQPAINPLSPAAHQRSGRVLPVDTGSGTYEHEHGSIEEEPTEPEVETKDPEATEEPKAAA